MIRRRSPPPQVDRYVAMPIRNQIMFPGVQDNGTGHYSSQPHPQTGATDLERDNVHLPQIRKDTPNSKSDRKPNRFFKFSTERQSFTENLLSLFTGHKDKGHDKLQAVAQEARTNGTAGKKDGSTRQLTDVKRVVLNKNERALRSNNNQTNNNRQPLRRSDKARITATTKNEMLRPSSSNKNIKGVRAEVESDVGGYENMFKMKQPAGKFNVPRKRSLEISEYLRRENYKYNERTAKQFLFQKWLRSTEVELPEHYPVEQNDSIKCK